MTGSGVPYNITLSSSPGGSAITGSSGAVSVKKVVNWNDPASWDTIPNGTDADASINDSNLGGCGLGFGANTTVGSVTLNSSSTQDFSLLGLATGTSVYTLTLAASGRTPAFTNASSKIFGLPGTAAQNQKLKFVGTQGLALYGNGGFRLCSGVDWSGLSGTITIAKGQFAPQSGSLMPTANRIVVGAGGLGGNLNFISGRDQTILGLDGDSSGIVNGGGNLFLGPNSLASDSFNFAGALQMGSGTLTWNGLGTQILSGTSSTYTGSTTVQKGVLAGVGANAFGSTVGITVQAAGTLSLRGDASTAFVKASDNTAYPVIISASGATINADQATAAGVGAKVMTIGAVSSTSTEATYQLNFTGANNTSLGLGNVTGSASTAAANVTIANAMAGGGTLTLAGYTSANSSGGETLTFNGVGKTAVSGAIAPSASTVLNVKYTGSGSLQLAGASTYTGGTAANGGVLQIANATALGSGAVTLGGSGTLDLNGQTIANAITTITSGGVLTNSGSAAGVSTAIGNANSSQLGNFTVGGSGSITLNDVFGAQFGCTLTKTGNGPLTLGGTGVNGVNGNPMQLVINAGTVVLSKTGSGCCADSVALNSGAVLQMDPSHTLTSGWQAWAGQINNGLTISGGTFDLQGVTGRNNLMRFLSGSGVVTNGSSSPAELQITSREANSLYTFSGTIADGPGAGTISISFTNSGSLNSGRTNVFAGNNTYSGDTMVGFGTFELGHANAAQNSTVILAASSGLATGASLFEFASGIGAFVIGGLKGSQNFILTDVSGSAITLNVGNNGADTTYSGGMTGSGAITKIGAGKLTLSGPNSFTGNTVVSNGILALTGSGSIANSANILVASKGTFDVAGLTSTFTLGAGKSLGNVANTGTIAGGLNLGSGGLALIYTNGTPSLLMTNGTLTFNGNSVTVTVTGTQLGGGSYKLISKAISGNAGLVAGTLPSSVTVNGAGAVAAGTLQIINGELYLVVNHPPVASTLNVTRTAGLSLKIPWSSIVATWSDADSEPVSLNTFNLTTTNGITLYTNGTWIFYTNTVNVADQFSYTIIDSQGATSTGLVNISVNPFVMGQNATVSVNGSSADVSFNGIPGYSYITQRSTNMVDWVDLTTNTVPTNGVFVVQDTFGDLGAPPGSAFYRLKWQP